jgi:hypothetical protein
MHAIANSPSDLEILRSAVAGPVLAPADHGYDGAREAWNLAADQRPAVVAHAGSADDVAAAVGFARERGLRVAMQGTGHGATAMEGLEGSLLLKTRGMSGVEVDPDARRARAEAGVLWDDVATRAAEHGLVALHGSSPDTCVTGYSLGGGLGWLARSHGLACNSVLAVEAVTADGERVRASRDEHPDLFWALRGGGGSFAAVTALEFALYPVTEVYAGWLVWDAEAGSDVVHAYREWARDAPREVTASLRFLHLPPFPEVPEPLRDRAVVAFDAAFLGAAEDGAELLRPLRDVAPLVMESFDAMPASGLTRLHGDPEEPMPGIGDGIQIAELPADAADAFVEVGGAGSDSPLLILELRQLGGALADVPADAGALGSLPGEFQLYGFGLPMGEGVAPAIVEHLDRVFRTMEPWMGQRYLNFAETPGAAPAAFDEETYGRLREVKTRYDGGDLFQANHPIPPAG